jgi:hypothetical protein
MNPLRSAFTLTSIAFLVGIGIVAAGIQFRHPAAVFAGNPIMASDDMGTSGVGYPSDALPIATSAIH